MEKTWDDFYKTGKITDYLKYVNSVSDQKKDKEWEDNGAVSCVDRDGANRDACRRL